jgi:hypothetical protein
MQLSMYYHCDMFALYNAPIIKVLDLVDIVSKNNN